MMYKIALLYSVYWVYGLLLCPVTAVAQDSVRDSLPAVKMISRVQQKRILLRWAVDEPIAWQITNEGGFILTKYMFSRAGQRVSAPEKVWEKTIRADPLETWREIVEKNNYAAIIAQALYGERFQVGVSQGKLADIVNLSQEAEQRFSFGLLAADMNFEAAVKAGWGYIDTEVKPEEKYVYTIRSALPQEQLAIDGMAVLAGLEDYELLPKPIDLDGVFGDKQVIVIWEHALFKTIYMFYNLERSEDGIHFEPLSKEPLLDMNDKEDDRTGRMYHIDSLAQNNKTYYYRINGISSFGEYGPYSDTISGQGLPVLPYTPNIRDFTFTENPNEAVIMWEFPREGEAITRNFQLNQATKDEGPYRVVIDSIPATQRAVTYAGLEPSNYFTITAVGKTPNQQKTSFSTLIQPVDTIPPAVPVGLQGEIDTLGIVRIDWKNNTEQDFFGYRVFRAFTEKEESMQLTVSPRSANRYTDTVEVKNLNARVYYQVVAVDKRFNHSEKSDVLTLEKPDLIPPTAPIFSDYKTEKGTVALTWIPSSEEGAIHVLSRRHLIADSTTWEDIYTAMDSVRHYVDEAVEADQAYRYRIRAVDRGGLESLPSTPLTVRVVDLVPQDLIRSFEFTLDRKNNYVELFWRTDARNISEYTLYKQTDEEAPSTWRIVPATVKRLEDDTVAPNHVYTYHLRATLAGGKYTLLKTVTVKY